MVSIGGGGLISGIAVAIKETNPKIRVIGVQAAALPSMERSLAAGQRVVVPSAVTIADGIAVKQPGAKTFPIVQRYVDEVVTVSDEEIAAAILLLLEREKTLVEGAGAATLAAVYSRKLDVAGRKVAMVLSGGNIDVSFLARIIERGLVKDGRMVRLAVSVDDRPGALARLAALVGELKANILHISHSRAFAQATLGQARVDLLLETRGREHIGEITQALVERGYAVEESR